MRWGITLFVLSTILLAACGPVSTSSYDSETLAAYHMERADSLEGASRLQDAAFEYKLVVELYPKTSHYPDAVLNTALLHSNPANPTFDDSLSVQWFQRYLSLPISREQRAKAEVYVSMLIRLASLQKEIMRRNSTIDSLQNTARRLSGDIAGRNKRIQDLESELKQATVELERLREVDVRINRRRGSR